MNAVTKLRGARITQMSVYDSALRHWAYRRTWTADTAAELVPMMINSHRGHGSLRRVSASPKS